MKRSFWLRFLAGMLCVLTLFGFSGCKKQQNITSGGSVDETDYNAPKVIESKEITSFYSYFYIDGLWAQGVGGRQYDFQITKNDAGVLTASELTTNISVPADEALFAQLQEIIDRHALVEKNGVCRYSIGVAPECQKCGLTADYASGEKLIFTIPNDIYAEWEKDLYLTLAQWFADNGEPSLLPTE